MEFLRERVFTSLNADELSAGDKVIVASTMRHLKEAVSNNEPAEVLEKINGEGLTARFMSLGVSWHLAYLVERAENCTNCGEGEWDAEHQKIHCNPAMCGNDNVVFRNHEIEVCEYWKPKTKKAEPHYRPFRGTDELIKVFCEKTPKIYDKDDEKLFMPYIWVRNKSDRKVWLITEFDNRILDYLFTNCEFLDGSPCGVEE